MLYCLGNALVDYEFRLSEEQLKEIGIAKGLMTLATKEQFMSCFNSLRAKLEYQRAGGGSAINSLITYARLGGKGALSCIVGKDESGDFFLSELRDLGVSLHIGRSIKDDSTISSNMPTGHCIAMITPDAERTMMTYPGINAELAAYPNIPEALASSEVFYAESYLLSLTKTCAVLMDYLAEARRQDKLIALSMSDVSMVEHFRQEMHQMLSGGVDILFGNLGEFAAYSGGNQREPKKIFDFFMDGGYKIKTLVITMGAEGAAIVTKDNLIKIPAYETELRDTLGAGDTYAGAFLYALCEKQTDYETTGIFAAYMAAKVISRMGPRLSYEECCYLLDNFNA